MLIAFEGIDGSGKNTQSRLLAEAIKAKLISFPRYYDSFSGRLLRRYLDGEFGGLGTNHPLLVALLYAVDRFESRVDPRYAGNKTEHLVCDRYVDSNVAYQSAKVFNGSFKDPKWLDVVRQIERFEYEIFRLPEPDLVIYLDIRPERSSERTSKRDTNGDIHQDNINYLKAVRRIYLKMARENPNWRLIETFDQNNNDRTVSDLHNCILQTVNQAIAECRSNDGQ